MTIHEHFGIHCEETQQECSLESVAITYDRLLTGLKVRTVNVLNSWRESFPDDPEFFQRFFTASPHRIKNLRNCGSRTLTEIMALRDHLRCLYGEVFLEEDSAQQHAIPDKLSLPGNIDEVLPVFLAMIHGLSTRAKNRMLWLLHECNNSVSAFYNRICAPDCMASIPTIGPKTIPEIDDFFARTIEFLKQCHDQESVRAHIRHHLLVSPFEFGLSEDAFEMLLEKEQSLGYFPIFASIQCYLENRPEVEKTIINGCLRIYQDQRLPKLKQVAALLKITKERVQQKRSMLISELSEYYKLYLHLGIVGKNPYPYPMRHIEDKINAAEGTHFNRNFVYWVLGTIFDEFTLIGMPVKSIGGCYYSDQYLYIVPTALTPLFDFETFINQMNHRMMKKRHNEERVCLKDIIHSHLKMHDCEDEMPEIDTVCRTILSLHFPVKVDAGYVFFPPNAYKSNPLVIEEMLRAAGRPMAFLEILEAYRCQYPERDSNANSLRGAICQNANIIPIGRTGTYLLAEWNRPEWRNGTIRALVRAYIDSTPEKIASADAIVEYVLKFHPCTNRKNIISNLKLDQDQVLVPYYKDGERYLGYADKSYPIEFFPVESDHRTSVANSIGYPRLLKFVKKYRRFPFRPGYTKEECFLGRFWIKQESRYQRNVLDSHAKLFFEKIKRAYGKYRLEKTER